MTGSRRSRRAAAASLRERLVGGWGWTALEEPPCILTVGRQRYRLSPVAEHGGWVIRLCDPPGGGALPAYTTRRRLHARAERRVARTVVVFCDGAGTEQVWAWRARLPVGVQAYREESRWISETDDGSGEDFDFSRETAVARGLDSEAAARGAEEVRQALLARLRRHRVLARELSGGSGAAALQALLEESRTVDVPRIVWREIERLRVIDPSCGSGGWLLGCLEALAAVGDSCLARMKVWVEENRRAEKPGRPEKLSDFKRLVARAAELSREGRPDRFARETILLCCLYGAERDGRLAEACRGRLTATLRGMEGDGSGAESGLAAIRDGSLCGGIASAEELAQWGRRDAGTAALARRVSAEARALGRIETLLVRARLRQGGALADLVEGLGILRARRAALEAALSSEPGPAACATVHPWLEYESVVRAGGFDLVRQAGGPTEAVASGGPG